MRAGVHCGWPTLPFAGARRAAAAARWSEGVMLRRCLFVGGLLRITRCAEAGSTKAAISPGLGCVRGTHLLSVGPGRGARGARGAVGGAGRKVSRTGCAGRVCAIGAGQILDGPRPPVRSRPANATLLAPLAEARPGQAEAAAFALPLSAPRFSASECFGRLGSSDKDRPRAAAGQTTTSPH